MKLKLLLLVIFFAMAINSHAQDLSSHQWEDRLVLILVDDTGNSAYQDQIEELYSDPQGLKDRKLVIYTVLPEKFKRDDGEAQGWIESGEIYSEYKSSNSSFEILLIGLDGGIKLRQDEAISNEDLFARIDRMPMRQRELENERGNDY